MDIDTLTQAALALPEAAEGAHMGNLDFRVRKKVFATYDAKTGLVGLKLTPEQRGILMGSSDAFFPANGSWGAKGWTKATLTDANEDDMIAALRMSWTNAAPVTLARTLGEKNETD